MFSLLLLLVVVTLTLADGEPCVLGASGVCQSASTSCATTALEGFCETAGSLCCTTIPEDDPVDDELDAEAADVNEAQGGGYSVAVIGDSLTVGMKARLQQLLGASLASFTATVGDRTAQAMAKATIGSSVSRALVGLGTNDFWDSASNYENNVRNAIAKMRQASPRIEIFWTNIYAPRADVAAGATRLNEVLNRIAASDNKFKIIDWKTEAVTKNYKFAADNLHPTQYNQRAEFVFRRMNELATGGGQTPDDPPPVPPPRTPATNPCSYRGVSGSCKQRAVCGGGREWVASSVGATGCEKLPADVRCCVAAPSTADWGSCRGIAGKCQDTSTQCNRAYQSGFCPGPSNIRCCPSGGAEFVAPVTPSGGRFPVAPGSLRSISVNWGGSRSGGRRCHAGIDLYTQSIGRVVAIADGVVTGVLRNWYTCSGGTIDAILVHHSSGPAAGKTVNYAEVTPGSYSVSVGATVRGGDSLGSATRCGMLHLELYSGRQSSTQRWFPSGSWRGSAFSGCATNYLSSKPAALLDPRPLINSLKPAGARFHAGTSFLNDNADESGASAEDAIVDYPQDENESSETAGIVAGAVIGAILLLVVVVAVVFAMRRRRNNNSNSSNATADNNSNSSNVDRDAAPTRSTSQPSFL